MRQFHPGRPMPPSSPPAPPPLWQIVSTAIGAVLSMIAALYFAGREMMPVALVGTTGFVLLGGVAFELARRRAMSSQ